MPFTTVVDAQKRVRGVEKKVGMIMSDVQTERERGWWKRESTRDEMSEWDRGDIPGGARGGEGMQGVYKLTVVDVGEMHKVKRWVR